MKSSWTFQKTLHFLSQISFWRKLFIQKKNYPPSLSHLSLSLSLSHEDFPSYEHLLALFTIICKLVPTKVINVAPKCSLGQKTKSFSQKYLGLGKSQGEGVSHCLWRRGAWRKHVEWGGFRVPWGWMLAYGHMGLVVNTENNGNHEVLMLGGCDILITNLWLIIGIGWVTHTIFDNQPMVNHWYWVVVMCWEGNLWLICPLGAKE